MGYRVLKRAKDRLRAHLPALTFLAAAATLFFWPLWVAGYRFPRGGGDLWGQLYAVWSFVAEWVRRGVFPLWDFRLMGGDPILAEGQYGLLNPLNWPLFLTSPIPTALVLLRGAFPLFLAGAGTYLYLRHSPVWRVSRPAALIGAVAYMLADPFIAHLGHPHFNDGMAWLPWALWGVDAATRRRRGILWGALALALLLLSGHGQAALYSALTIGGYALWQAAEGGWRRGPRRLGRLGLMAVLAAALAAPAILPGMERLPFTDRALVPLDLRRGYEFQPAMLVDFISPAFHGRGVDAFWPRWNRVESGYVGAVALGLAGLGLLSHLRQRRTWALLALGGLAYEFAIGYRGVLYPRLAQLPLFAESWKTSRAIYLVSFALALAAALGVERLRRGPRWMAAAWAAALAVAGAALWLGAPAWAATIPGHRARAQALTGLRFAALLSLGAALLGWIASRRHVGGRAGLVLLLLVELVALGALVEVEPSRATGSDPSPALSFLKADSAWFRVDVDGEARGLVSPSLLMAAGFEVPQGTGNPMELAAYNQFYWAIPYKSAPAYRLLGVKYILVPKDAPPGGEGIWPVFIDDPKVDVHLHTGALPRVWLVYRTLPVTRIEEAYDVIFDPAFAPEQVATVEDGPLLDGSGQGRIDVIGYGPNRLAMSVQASDPALFILSDVLYPGWEATLDGAPVPIYRADGIFRGVEVPAGQHRLEMRFRPRSLRLGLGAAGMAAWVLSVACVWRVACRGGGRTERQAGAGRGSIPLLD